VTATLQLTQMLASMVGAEVTRTVTGSTVAAALESLFAEQPILRTHILDESGAIRPHVAVFVDGTQAGLDAPVPDGAKVYVLHAVSGG
jgi:molybdopterin synthase sulfur carrier subunit